MLAVQAWTACRMRCCPWCPRHRTSGLLLLLLGAARAGRHISGIHGVRREQQGAGGARQRQAGRSRRQHLRRSRGMAFSLPW